MASRTSVSPAPVPPDEIFSHLLRFARGKDVELACAAVKVLGALPSLPPRSAEKVFSALVELLAHPNATLVHYALAAVAPLASRRGEGEGEGDLLARVASLLSADGPVGGEKGEAAAFLAARLAEPENAGKTLSHLSRCLSGKEIRAARAALSVLAGAKEGREAAWFLPALRSADEMVVREGARLAREALEGDSPGRREIFLEKVRALCARKEVRSSPAALAACVRLLSAAGAATAALLAYAGRAQAGQVRAAALRALARRAIGKGEARKAAKTALAALSAAREEESAVVEAAADLLKTLPPEKGWLASLEAGLESEGPARAAALSAAARMPPAVAVPFLFPLLSHADADLRRACARALGAVEGAVRPLLDRFDRRLSNDAARAAADALAAARERFTGADRRTLVARIAKLAAAEDPTAELLLEVAREAAPEEAAEVLLALAKKEKRPQRRRALLARTLRIRPDLPEAALPLALLEIRESPKDLSSGARAQDQGLSRLSGPARTDPKGAARTVAESAAKGAGKLSAADLYYIGFHFSERSGNEGGFGRAVLQELIRRFPKDERAAAARNKLKLSRRS